MRPLFCGWAKHNTWVPSTALLCGCCGVGATCSSQLSSNAEPAHPLTHSLTSGLVVQHEPGDVVLAGATLCMTQMCAHMHNRIGGHCGKQNLLHTQHRSISQGTWDCQQPYTASHNGAESHTRPGFHDCTSRHCITRLCFFCLHFWGQKKKEEENNQSLDGAGLLRVACTHWTADHSHHSSAMR